MQETQDFSIEKLYNGINKASQKIIQSYVENFSGYNHDSRDIALAYSGFITKMLVNPKELFKIQNLYLDFLKNQQEIWGNIFINHSNNNQPVIIPQAGDKRFLAPEWNEHPYFNFIKQNYLLVEKLAKQVIGEIELGDGAKKKINFYTKQYINAFSPANFLATNPEALKLAIKTNGKSLWQGFNALLKDIEKGRITQTDESAFKVGKNIAVTPGFVVYENELIQLIQYTPTQKKVHATPLLIIPPWINKYYILDLQPKNSLVKFLVDKGYNVYIISWRNPTPDMSHFTFDDYVQQGAMQAIKVAQEISKEKKINTLGYCLGGTLLGVASAIFSADKKDNPINSATFLASMIDFTDIGPMGDVIDVALVKKLERGELLKDGIMHGYNMEWAFDLIRPNDLIWNYAVKNYLKGEAPDSFDVIYWTNDNTNLPAKMYVYYMRKMILENKLSRKNALRICNTLIDIGKINFPVSVVGLREDYISPAKTCFTTTELVSGPVEFILGGSGHVMGVVNPPSKNKYGYYLDGKLEYGFDEWHRTAKFYEGSWWTPWSEWLHKNSGKLIDSTAKAGSEKHKILETAPGCYVKKKC